MADQQERVRETARRIGLQAIGAELERRVGCRGCPAAQFIGAVREDGMPGVRCRVEHSTLTLGSDPSTILRWCSQGPWDEPRHSDAEPSLNGYANCPTWEYEKLRLALGMHSLGDERRMEELEQRTWREDVTGSAYGDTSHLDEVNAAVRDTMEAWQEQYAEGLGQ
jgi:hypothetical protein